MTDTHWVIDCPRPGGLEALLRVKQPIPKAGHGELLIRVHAAGVNRADIAQRTGIFPMPPGLSTVLGLEISGEVVGRGPGTSRYGIGDKVCCLLSAGGYAEHCVAAEACCMPIPEGVDLIGAAALPEAAYTVWISLIEQAEMQPGETVLVHGGASGIGTMAIQMAAAFGARVFTTAGSAERCEACRRLGATLAIDYKTEAFEERIAAFAGERAVDVVIDIVGAPYVQRNLSLLARSGRICYVGFPLGQQLDIDILQVMLLGARISGVTLRHRPLAEKARIAAALERRLWPAIAAKRIRPIVDLVLPFARAAEAHEALDAGKVTGKAVLVML